MKRDAVPNWWSQNMLLQPELQDVRGWVGRYAPMPHPVRVKPRDPEIALGAIKALVGMKARLDHALKVEVASARAAGCTWEDVASVLGVSHQAAIKKYAKYDPHYAAEGPASLK